MSGPKCNVHFCSQCGQRIPYGYEPVCCQCRIEDIQGGPGKSPVQWLRRLERFVYAGFEQRDARIESLERWRMNMHGTYKATEEDRKEWSGENEGGAIKNLREQFTEVERRVKLMEARWNDTFGWRYD